MNVIQFGNMWAAEYSDCHKVVTTNGIVKKDGTLTMGAGVAHQAAVRHTELPKILGEYVQKYGSRVFILPQFKIITFPTKFHWKDKSDIGLIQTSLMQMMEVVEKYSIEKVIAPGFGCGNGKLNWNNDVRPICAQVLDNRFTIIVKAV